MFRQPFRGDYPISQLFGEKDTDPKGHRGIDYLCPTGTEILASADGVVMKAGWDNTGYGNHVIILHDAKHATLYAHLSKITVYTNQIVKQSEVIGLSGNTGNTTGAHLHFEYRTQWNNWTSAKDPMLLPLTNFADAVPAEAEHQPIKAGMVKVVCDWPANVRNTYNHAIVNGQKHKGDVFEITEGTKMINGLPYHRIVPKHVDDLGGLIAEYDSYGTQILEEYGEQED